VLDRSLNVRDAHTLHRRIEERQRLKEMRLDTQRRSKEVQEVAECTFTPDVLSGPALPAGPVIVKGMGRHLELKGLARQQQQEQEERERRAFKLQAEESRSPYTVRSPCSSPLFCFVLFFVSITHARQGACAVQLERGQG
jgi:hypothetical protein